MNMTKIRKLANDRTHAKLNAFAKLLDCRSLEFDGSSEKVIFIDIRRKTIECQSFVMSL